MICSDFLQRFELCLSDACRYKTAAGGTQEQACESECLRIPGYETIPSSGVKQFGRGSNRYLQMMGSLQDAGVSIYGSPIPAFQQANGEDSH